MPKARRSVQRSHNNESGMRELSESAAEYLPNLRATTMLSAAAGAVAGAAVGFVLANDEYRERAKRMAGELLPDGKQVKEAVDRVMSEVDSVASREGMRAVREVVQRGVTEVGERMGIESDTSMSDAQKNSDRDSSKRTPSSNQSK